MVGDPGIEPGAGRPGGVTVPCRTLQRVAHWVGGIAEGLGGVKRICHGFGLALLPAHSAFWQGLGPGFGQVRPFNKRAQGG